MRGRVLRLFAQSYHLQQRSWDSTQPPGHLSLSATLRYFNILSSPSAIEGMSSHSCGGPRSRGRHITPRHPRIPTKDGPSLDSSSLVVCLITRHGMTARYTVPYHTGKSNHVKIASVDAAQLGCVSHQGGHATAPSQLICGSVGPHLCCGKFAQGGLSKFLSLQMGTNKQPMKLFQSSI